MHILGKDQLITPWTLRKRVQEGNAWKKTNLNIWMHLLQKKIHLTAFDLLTNFLLLRMHKKEDYLTF